MIRRCLDCRRHLEVEDVDDPGPCPCGSTRLVAADEIGRVSLEVSSQLAGALLCLVRLEAPPKDVPCPWTPPLAAGPVLGADDVASWYAVVGPWTWAEDEDGQARLVAEGLRLHRDEALALFPFMNPDGYLRGGPGGAAT